jgi:toxin ParE1/3/4
MAQYILSQEADEDFVQLFEYGIDNFGANKAIAYSKGLKRRFSEIAENPFHWQGVDYIRNNYRRRVYRNHSIYYMIKNNNLVRIVRILNKENILTSLNLLSEP